MLPGPALSEPGWLVRRAGRRLPLRVTEVTLPSDPREEHSTGQENSFHIPEAARLIQQLRCIIEEKNCANARAPQRELRQTEIRRKPCLAGDSGLPPQSLAS